ncbi:hypothetical protein HKCCE2091_09690 [Rhodobacterales bacterium HKCCE2091]|nr:hypothetical protein [Rhodobacterales bacterium HKCCE2091]
MRQVMDGMRRLRGARLLRVGLPAASVALAVVISILHPETRAAMGDTIGALCGLVVEGGSCGL